MWLSDRRLLKVDTEILWGNVILHRRHFGLLKERCHFKKRKIAPPRCVLHLVSFLKGLQTRRHSIVFDIFTVRNYCGPFLWLYEWLLLINLCLWLLLFKGELLKIHPWFSSVLWMEPRALSMVGQHSATETHPHPQHILLPWVKGWKAWSWASAVLDLEDSGKMQRLVRGQFLHTIC